MSTPLYTTLIPDFFQNVLQPLINQYVFNGYNALATHLRAPLGFAVVLAIMLLGFGISQGWVEMAMSTFIKFATKVGLIYGFAMHWSLFSQYGVNGIQGAAAEVGHWLVNATPITLPHFAGSGIEGALQSVLIEVTDIGTWAWQAGGLREPSPWLLAVLIWGFGYTMLLLGTFEIVLAKLMLAILFTLAPLFISFTLFKPTQGFFDRWLGLIASYAFLLIFISAALAFALNFAEWALQDLYNTHALSVELIDFVPAIFVCFMGIGIIFKVTEMSHHIGNGVCTSAAMAMVAGNVGGFLGGMKWVYQKIKP